MALWEIAVIVLALAWVVVAGCVIPLLLRLRRTAERAENLLREAELHVGPALADVREMARHLNKLSAEVADGVSRVSRTLETALGPTITTVGALIAGVGAAARVLRRRTAVWPTITAASGFIAGVGAAARVLRGRLFRRR